MYQSFVYVEVRIQLPSVDSVFFTSEKNHKICINQQVLQQVYILAKAIERAKSLSAQDIIAAAAGVEVDAPSGKIRMHETNHHCYLNTYIGQVQEDLTYKILASSDGLVEPKPE